MPDIRLAERLFAELRDRTGDGSGITRQTYGPGENLAHAIVRREGEALGLRVETDAACNLYLTLPSVRPAPRLIIGSHLDSVPRGGTFDGAAGVLLGLSVVAGLVASHRAPPRPVTIMAIRAEESAWFSASYIGSRAAFGQVSAEELETVRRAGDGALLSDAIDAAGGSSEDVAAGACFLRTHDVSAFIEPHIEQGPVLAQSDTALGLVTDIRGSLRYRGAQCAGAYAHSGTAPRELRKDAVVAVSALVSAMDRIWQKLEAEGHDLTVTFGQIATDPEEASFSKVAGHVRFSLDMRSNSSDTLAIVDADLRTCLNRVEQERGVEFDLGPTSSTEPAVMDPGVLSGLSRATELAGHGALEMPCGAGHDAATFSAMGVPTGLLFLRNWHGSHNPDEHMDMADFAAGADVLMRFCLDGSGTNP